MSSTGYDDENRVESDEEDTMDFDTQEEPQEYYGFGACNTSRPPLEKTELDFLNSLSRSDYLPGALEYIKGLPITDRYKRSLTAAVETLLNRDTAFANSFAQKTPFGQRDPLKVKAIDAKLILKKTILDASKDDTLVINPQTFTDEIYTVFLNYASLSVGNKRARLLATTMSTSVTNVNETSAPEESVSTPRKKSFWSFGGKK